MKISIFFFFWKRRVYELIGCTNKKFYDIYVSCRCLLGARTLLDWCCLVPQVCSIITEMDSGIQVHTILSKKNVRNRNMIVT